MQTVHNVSFQIIYAIQFLSLGILGSKNGSIEVRHWYEIGLASSFGAADYT